MAQAGAVLELILAHRREEAVALIRSVARAASLAAVVALLAEVQREVGRRWQVQELTVADEHAATAIVDVALTAATLAAGPRRPAVAPAIVVACAEEEWHVLPARMFAEQLAENGWDVVFLGASTPAEHLQRFVAASRPAAVTLSCTVPLHLPGARRTVSASHAAGVPVLAGGAAFGGTPRRAEAIGADAWASSAGGAADTLTRWIGAPPVLAAPTVGERPALALGAARPALVERAMTALADRFPPLAGYSAWQMAKTREDLDYIVRFAEASLLTGDDTIVTEFARWLASVLSARGLPGGVVSLGASVLRDCLPGGFAEADRLFLAMMTSS